MFQINRSNHHHIYILMMLIFFGLGILLRFSLTDITRPIVVGDESAYEYAAKNLLKYHKLTNDRYGDMFHEKSKVQSASNISIGYPLFIALIYLLGGTSKTVFIIQIILSMLSMYIIWKLLEYFNINKIIILTTMALVCIYPGFLYNLNRMLAEQVFSTVFLCYVYYFLKGLDEKHNVYLFLSSLMLIYAIFVRPFAFPFIFLSVFCIIIYENTDRISIFRKLLIFLLPILALLVIWWIRNALIFHRFILNIRCWSRSSDMGGGCRILLICHLQMEEC